MAILLNRPPRVLVQGITGKEGRRATAAMRAYGTDVVCGVTPGKGGQEVDGLPVYGSVAEARAKHPNISAASIYVPSAYAKAAIMEAIEAGIPLVHVITEKIPIRDVSACLAAARERGAQILGPASIGVLAPAIGRLGMIGGENPENIYTPGPIGVISRSGGMTNEVSWMVRRAGLGQSTSVAIGGDYLIGTRYADLLPLFEADPDTRGIVIFGEVGGAYENAIAALVGSGRVKKPVAVFLAGRFAKHWPEGVPVGHAGAFIEGGRGGVEEKEATLREAGVLVAERYEDLPLLIKSACRL